MKICWEFFRFPFAALLVPVPGLTFVCLSQMTPPFRAEARGNSDVFAVGCGRQSQIESVSSSLTVASIIIVSR
jgi:hypothetical protein